jgi:hypothetical protein
VGPVTFDDLDFFDANIENIELTGPSTLRVDLSKVSIVTETRTIARCRLEFTGVTHSERIVCEHLKATTGFAPSRTITDVAEQPRLLASRLYELEGRLVSPSAWIHSWHIIATACTIRLDL